MKTRLALLPLFVLCLALALSVQRADSLPVPPNGPSEPAACIPSGGIDDTLYNTNCCSGRAVPGSTYCINPLDWYTTWASCSQICA